MTWWQTLLAAAGSAIGFYGVLFGVAYVLTRWGFKPPPGPGRDGGTNRQQENVMATVTAIRPHCCPECGASNVECRRDPDNDRRCIGHVCHSCGATTEIDDG